MSIENITSHLTIIHLMIRKTLLTNTTNRINTRSTTAKRHDIKHSISEQVYYSVIKNWHTNKQVGVDEALEQDIQTQTLRLTGHTHHQ